MLTKKKKLTIYLIMAIAVVFCIVLFLRFETGLSLLNIRGLSEYKNPAFHVSILYPKTWQADLRYSKIGGVDGRYYGIDGFFSINSIGGTVGESAMTVAKNMAFNKRATTFGTSPLVSSIIVDGQEAALILPSSDQSKALENEAAIVVKYPKAFTYQKLTYRFLIIYADKNHIEKFIENIEFDKY